MVPEALAAADGWTSWASAPTSSASPAPTCSSAPPRHAEVRPIRRPGSSPPTAATPMVTVLDGHPHTLAFLGAGHATINLGVTEFGQTGDLADI